LQSLVVVVEPELFVFVYTFLVQASLAGPFLTFVKVVVLVVAVVFGALLVDVQVQVLSFLQDAKLIAKAATANKVIFFIFEFFKV
jgi:hypothetical protein